jgi:hypothetical protein
VVRQNVFDHVVLLINGQVEDIVVQWAVSADVLRLATPVA